jgi:nicotinate-nucleotide pyrophosphorylase (carboxylating)
MNFAKDTRIITQIIDLALEEDGQDKTSEAIFSPDDCLHAALFAKEAGIIAGIAIAREVFYRQDSKISFDAHVSDGIKITPGFKIASVHGPARGVLRAERVVLNFMQRMSGIATAISTYVKKCEGTKAKILDTRKTVPGHRILDKLAVRIGGGMNHRMGLYDMALIKDNHIDRVGSISEAVKRIRQTFLDLPIEVEARTLVDVKELMALKVDRIMLDNFAIEDLKKAVDLVNGQIPLEASGGITLANIRDVALTGVDFISVGAITHSVKALDITMLIEKNSNCSVDRIQNSVDRRETR